MGDEIDEAKALAVLSLLDWDDGAEVHIAARPQLALEEERVDTDEEDEGPDKIEAEVDAEWEAALAEVARLKGAAEEAPPAADKNKVAVADSGGVSLSLSASVLQKWEEDMKKEMEREEGDLA
jgi:hypothetical protein